jgi:hypothetical protein
VAGFHSISRKRLPSQVVETIIPAPEVRPVGAKFKEGERLVCIDANPGKAKNIPLSMGKAYTCVSAWRAGLVAIIDDSGESAYYQDKRFRSEYERYTLTSVISFLESFATTNAKKHPELVTNYLKSAIRHLQVTAMIKEALEE